MEPTTPQPGTTPQPPQPSTIHRWLVPVLVAIAGLMVAITLIARSNFLEGFLKLIGAGASELQMISISSDDDFLGTSKAKWLADTGERNDGVFDNTAAFNYFTGQPHDEGARAGFVMPLVSASEIDSVVTHPASYISPVVDLGSGELFVKALQAVDYQPEGSTLAYAYRAGETVAEAQTATFKVLEFVPTDTLGGYRRQQVAWEDGLPQFVQFRAIFANYVFADRPAVAELNIIYEGDGGNGEEAPADLLPEVASGILVDATIIITYASGSAPAAAEFDFSAEASGQSFARKQVSLDSPDGKAIFPGMGLLAGEDYIIQLKVAGQTDKVLKFTATSQLVYTFALTGFVADTSPADLNQDGVVNTLDYSLFLNELLESAKGLAEPESTP